MGVVSKLLELPACSLREERTGVDCAVGGWLCKALDTDGVEVRLPAISKDKLGLCRN